MRIAHRGKRGFGSITQRGTAIQSEVSAKVKNNNNNSGTSVAIIRDIWTIVRYVAPKIGRRSLRRFARRTVHGSIVKLSNCPNSDLSFHRRERFGRAASSPLPFSFQRSRRVGFPPRDLAWNHSRDSSRITGLMLDVALIAAAHVEVEPDRVKPSQVEQSRAESR